MQPITKFIIRGLFGTKDITLDIAKDVIILVGPNGIGKSSAANIFYFFVSRQWSRLAEYEFQEITLVIGGEVITARKSDISGLSDFQRVAKEIPHSSRIGGFVEKLSKADLLQVMITGRGPTPAERDEISNLLSIPREEVRMLQRSLLRRMQSPESDLFSQPRLSIEKAIGAKVDARILYLPTYRRIEKELREVIPDFEARYRSHTGIDTIASGRSEGHFVELVSFGMEDVRKTLNSKSREMRDYSLSQHNELSAVYLRDVIHGKADQYVAREINSLTDEGISEILDRVSEVALSKEDKELLRMKVKSIQGKKKNDVLVDDRFLAHYFSRLVAVNADITKRERDMKAFVDGCNAYLMPSKQMIYDELTFTATVLDEGGLPLELGMLSSGEKQVIAIFAHLFLDEIKDQIIVIDEPELSLSVPWQKRFLTDIMASGRCRFLLAVTHSPFIYDNDLRSRSVDLRRRTTASEGAGGAN